MGDSADREERGEVIPTACALVTALRPLTCSSPFLPSLVGDDDRDGRRNPAVDATVLVGAFLAVVGVVVREGCVELAA